MQTYQTKEPLTRSASSWNYICMLIITASLKQKNLTENKGKKLTSANKQILTNSAILDDIPYLPNIKYLVKKGSMFLEEAF